MKQLLLSFFERIPPLTKKVFYAHLFFLFVLGTLKKPSPGIATQKHIAVQTIELKPKLSAPVKSSPKKPSVAKATPKKASPQKPIPKKAQSKKETPIAKKAPSKEKTPDQQLAKKTDAQLKNVLANLEKIEPSKVQDLQEPQRAAPAKAPNVSSKTAAPTFAKVDNYGLQLASFLKRHLHLPEYGQVELSLLVMANGEIQEVIIHHSESKENKAYVAQELPKLKLPALGAAFKGEGPHKLSLTLSNDF